MTFLAKVIADSISEESGKRITTMQLCYPRFIHAEFKTHRILSSDSQDEIYVVSQSTGLMDDRNLSRNASSSRAIPVAKIINQVRNNPAMPIHWGKNQPGMQAAVESNELVLYHYPFSEEEDKPYTAQDAWKIAANHAADVADAMNAAGYHKQVVNRILEPFQWIHVIVTATEWDNFFELRDHEDAQPEIRHLAKLMKQAMDESIPTLLKRGEWHLPYITGEDIKQIKGHCNAVGIIDWIELARKVSAARCCRVSYLKHDGTQASIQEDIDLCDRLAAARPIHASPFEHQATPDWTSTQSWSDEPQWTHPSLHGNLVGWIQNRKLIEKSFV